MSHIYSKKEKKFILPDLPYAYGSVKGISADTDKFHHDKHFNSYITGLNNFDDKLIEMRHAGDYGAMRATMLSFSHNASGAYLHERYYSILGGDGIIDESLLVVQKIKQDFGSIDVWKKEFIEVAKISRGWAVLGYFGGDGMLRHNMIDFHDQQVVSGMESLIVCDMWEHAYYYDHGPEKISYIDAFLSGLSWKKIDDYFAFIVS